jgi:hypothetical protein
MTHYIADMAVFGHVMGVSTPWGAEVHHSDYEEYVNASTSAYIAEFNAFLSFDGNLDPISAYEAAKKLAYDTTFDTDGDLTCAWMDQNYNWNNPVFRNRAGESLNLAVNYVTDVLHTLYLEANMPEEYYLNVPHYNQTKSYYCGPAALEMVFDYYGADIPQTEIADVARTAPPPDGTYAPDMVRAAHFSNLSTSVGNEMPGSIQGYTARKLGYAALEHRYMTIDQLKFSIALGYPIIVLTTWHFRVAVGYNSTHITFQDSYWGRMYNMTYAKFDADWDYSNHWAFLVTPWKVKLTAPSAAQVGTQVNITAAITYPSPPPFSSSQYPSSLAKAKLILPSGISLATGQTAQKTVNNGDLTAGERASLNWTITANAPGDHVMGVEAEGMVEGYVPPLPSYPASYSYTDRIGGYNQISINVPWEDTIPPSTTPIYDPLWHGADFTITLTAIDAFSGVKETYYKINNGPTRTTTADGQPLMTTESDSNTLEFWSVDNAGNEEPHQTLTNIKLDKTGPTGSIMVNDDDTYVAATSVTLSLTASDTTSGVHQVRYSNDGIWDGEPWETPLTTKTWTLSSTDGVNTVYYQVEDSAGLTSATYSDSIVLDTTAPAIIVASPKQSDEIRSSTITATWFGLDDTSEISNYEIRLDGAPWTNIQGNAVHTFTDLPDGIHTIGIKAIDNAGNTKQVAVEFTVNTSPLLGPGYVEEGAVAAAMVAVALLVITYLARRKRKS